MNTRAALDYLATLGVERSRNDLIRQCRTGALESRCVGGRWYTRRDWIDAWITASTARARQPRKRSKRPKTLSHKAATRALNML